MAIQTTPKNNDGFLQNHHTRAFIHKQYLHSIYYRVINADSTIRGTEKNKQQQKTERKNNQKLNSKIELFVEDSFHSLRLCTLFII